MASSDLTSSPFYGVPRIRLATDLDRTPVVSGWSLGGLSAFDRSRLAAHVMADPRRGSVWSVPIGPAGLDQWGLVARYAR